MPWYSMRCLAQSSSKGNGCLIGDWVFDSVQGRENFLYRVFSIDCLLTHPAFCVVSSSACFPILHLVTELNMLGIILPAPICFHGVMLCEEFHLNVYCSTVVSMSNCTVLRSLETHHCCTWPSAYNLLHRFLGTELHQLTVWITLHLIWEQLPTARRSISQPHIKSIVYVRIALPPGRDMVILWSVNLETSYLQHSY